MDWIAELVSEFLKYAKTPDFRNGIFVEVGGMAIDIVLLVILVPLLTWVYGIPARRRANKLAVFMTLQFIRDGFTLLLKLGGCRSPDDELRDEIIRGNLKELSSHSIYGNTPDLMALLRLRMKGTAHLLGHRSLNNEAIDSLRVDAADLLSQCDRYTTLFAGLRMYSRAERYFQVRALLLVLRDYLGSLKTLNRRSGLSLDEFMGISTALAMDLDDWLSKEKRTPDRTYKLRAAWGIGKVLTNLPLALLHMFVVGPIFTRLAIRYRSPYRLEIARIMLEHAYKAVGSEKIFEALGMNGKQVRALLRKPSASEPILNAFLQIRDFYEPLQWDALLARELLNEMRRLNRNGFASFVKADALAIYSKAAFKPDQGIVMRIFLWEKTYDSMV